MGYSNTLFFLSDRSEIPRCPQSNKIPFFSTLKNCCKLSPCRKSMKSVTVLAKHNHRMSQMYLKLFMVNFIDRTMWYKNLDTWHKKIDLFQCVCIVLFICVLFSFVFFELFFFLDWGVFCVSLFYIFINLTIADSICSSGGVVGECW